MIYKQFDKMEVGQFIVANHKTSTVTNSLLVSSIELTIWKTKLQS